MKPSIKTPFKLYRYSWVIVVSVLFSCETITQDVIDVTPLDTWNNTQNRTDIINFVASVNNANIPASDRIATFDFDGTLGVEKPTYTEVIVSASKMCSIAELNPPLLSVQPYKASCEKDWKTINNSEKYTYGILLDAFLSQPVTTYLEYAQNFLTTVEQPRFNKTYDKLLYAPMIQLIGYLLENQFTVYIVSGSQTAFLRAMIADVGLPIPSDQIIGSTIEFTYQENTQGKIEFIRQDTYAKPMSDAAGKAELIMRHIGKMPIFAAGNTMGDYQMLLSSTSGSLINLSNGLTMTGFSLIVNHDDAAREYKYSAPELIKKASLNNWSIVSMKNDFKTMFLN